MHCPTGTLSEFPLSLSLSCIMKDTCLVSARLDEVYFKSLLSEITSLFLTLAHSVSLVLISDKILLPLKVQESIVIHLNELRMSCLLFSSSGSVCFMFSYLCEIFFSVSLSEGHSNTFILFIWTSKAYEYSYPLNKVSAALWNQRGECYFLFLVQVCYLLQLLWDNSLGKQECPSCCHALVSSQCHQKGASGLILGAVAKSHVLTKQSLYRWKAPCPGKRWVLVLWKTVSAQSYPPEVRTPFPFDILKQK